MRGDVQAVGLAILLTTCSITARADVEYSNVAVDAKCDIFSSGWTVATDPWDQPGLLPVEVSLPSGTNRWIEFSSVTGQTKAGPGWLETKPDGGTAGGIGTNIFSYNGISGMYHDRHLFLAGVFLTDAFPRIDLTPPRLNFQAIGVDFLELSPQTAQSFFIGDGQTTAGITQIFHVPDEATRFYLGFLDSNLFGWPNGNWPFAYIDNTGGLTASFDVYTVPEPSSLALWSAFSLVAIGGVLWRRHRRATSGVLQRRHVREQQKQAIAANVSRQ